MRGTSCQLSPEQISSLVTMCRRIAGLSRPGARDVKPDDDGRSGRFGWDRSNVFGFLGARGAGKSTLLQGFGALSKEDPTPPLRDAAEQLSKSGVHVSELIDCSTLPDGVNAGSTVLLRLVSDARLWGYAGPNPRVLNGSLSAEDKLKAELRGLAGEHVHTQPAYRELGLELATVPGDFARFVVEGIESRFRLEEKLSGCLETLCRLKNISTIVVPLDDFDLMGGTSVRMWVQALLGDLHQRRLAFVLTADFWRLEHVSVDDVLEIDDMTGRALIDKLLPSNNRVVLHPLGRDSQFAFQPLGMENGKPLGALFDAWQPGPVLGVHKELIRRLLPVLPRGLLNIHQVLEEVVTTERLNSTPRIEVVVELLGRLAACRNEPVLARRLETVPIENWVSELHWPPRGLPEDARPLLEPETWRSMVEAIEGRAASGAPGAGSGASSRALRPFAGLAPERENVDRMSSGRLPRSLSHDPAWGDPLRHDEYRLDPLGEAQGESRELWTELLLNLSLGTTPRHRVEFLLKWPPAAKRVLRSMFRVEFSREQLWEFFDSSEFERSLLPWLRAVPKSGGSHLGGILLEFGWTPMVNCLRGSTNAWPAELLSSLHIGPGLLSGDVSLPAEASSLELLPDQVRALILLVDALGRCPWEPLSAPRLGWGVLTYLRLAGAFVQGAYLYSLGRLVVLPPNDSREELLTQLDRPDPGLRVKQQVTPGRPQQGRLMDEHEVNDWLDRLDLGYMLSSSNDPVANSLDKAARAFRNLEAFKALRLGVGLKGAE